MASIETVEASVDTRRATGITHYVFDVTGGWKAFGAHGAEIATLVVLREAHGKGVLRVKMQDRRAEITYSIEHNKNKFLIDAVVDGIPSKATFSKDEGQLSEGFGESVHSSINEVFHSISRDLMTHRSARSHDGPHTPREMLGHLNEPYCGGLNDAATAAGKAGEWVAECILSSQWVLDCL